MTAVFNLQNEVRAFSVVSCSAKFTPTFLPPGSAPVTLMSGTLAGVDTESPPKFYYHHAPASTDDELIEDHGAFSLGISSVCADTDLAGTGNERADFVGDSLIAPEEVVTFRASTRPNFYAEHSNLVTRDKRGAFLIDLGDDGIYEHLQRLDTPCRS